MDRLMDRLMGGRIDRRHLLRAGVALGAVAWTGGGARARGDAGAHPSPAERKDTREGPGDLRLTVPEEGRIRVAFCISQGSNVIDTAGPWEVFQDTMVDRAGSHHHPFELATVAATAEPVRATGGLHLIPDFAVGELPEAPHVVVVPAMRASQAVLDWLRETARTAHLVMSVCTGAFQLARTGLLDGLAATTHHDFWDAFAKEFPAVELRRGPRYVEHARVATAGGLTSGFDLALRVVERYFDTDAARRTAEYMEYRSEAWRRK